MIKKIGKLVVLLMFLGIQLNAQHLADTLWHPRNVLIENFTGVKNGNCPMAMDIMDTIYAQNPGRISLLNIHAGFYANPTTPYTNDYRTSFGSAEDNYFGMGLAGNPDGLINREQQSGSPVIWPSNYSSFTNTILNSGNSPVNIGALATYNTNFNMLIVNTELYFTSTLSAGRLNVVLAEDSLYGPQCNYGIPNSCPMQYYNNHVLRFCLGYQWDGMALPASFTQQNLYSQQTFTYSVPGTINMNHSYVVVYVSDTTSGRTVYTTQTFPINFTNGLQSVANRSLSVFPNPTTGLASVFLPANARRLELINLLGEKVMTEELDRKNQTIGVDLSACQPGIYFITLTTSEGYITRKIIKQ